MTKTVFSLQPYKLGSRKSNTLGIVIPATIVKEEKIDLSTIFVIRKRNHGEIILEKIDNIRNSIPEEGSPTPTQQVFSRK